MKTNFIISAGHDIRLLPFSPVCERDTLEIRVQGYNDGEEGEVPVCIKIDDEIIFSEDIHVKRDAYGFCRCHVPMQGRCGTHTVSVNGVTVPLVVYKEPLAKLDGGFIIIGPPNDRIQVSPFREDLKAFTDANWREYVEKLAETGCQCIIFHNCQEYLRLYDTEKPIPENITAHYPSELHPKSDIRSEDPIGVILETAQSYNMHVFLSVGNCYGHTNFDEDFYELYDLYGKYKSFYGWYLTNEVNMSRTGLEGWEILRHQCEVIREISPVKPILISPFDYPCPPVLEYLKTHDVFDIMMPQDCVGSGRFDLKKSADMHKILGEICTSLQKHFWANCEAFNFKENLLVPRFKDGGMDGESGFVQQIETVRPFVEKIMNFAYTGFFAPPGFAPKLGGDAAVKQYEEYQKYYKKICERI